VVYVWIAAVAGHIFPAQLASIVVAFKRASALLLPIVAVVSDATTFPSKRVFTPKLFHPFISALFTTNNRILAAGVDLIFVPAHFTF